jgi:phospholipase C
MAADDDQDPSRRAFLAGSAAALGAAGILGAQGCTPQQQHVLATATRPPAAPAATLSDIRHIVILMQENRSFDHYFGTLSATRGFSDPAVLRHAGRPVYDQAGYRPGRGADASGFLQPFRLLSHPPRENGQSTNDIAHDWVTQHESWGHGAMDKFVAAHVAADGTVNGPLTMGYFTRADLPFYYALADAFTICDGYFCSVLGPTDPNRVMAVSATIDPAGAAGGPVLVTRETDRAAHYGKLRWETMPERLLDAGVSWKVYNDPLGLLALSPLPYFRAFTKPKSARSRALISRGIAPSYPGDFKADVARGTLPSVSWIIPPLAQCEHPAAPPAFGEFLVSQVLATLVARPALWAQTVLIVVYDENGGFFDHVPPPTAPAGTAGEYLTASALPAAAGGVTGPVGLGFRTPALVISPFTRGGYRYSGPLDHTSVLRLIERRFGVPVPNLSAWRRGAVGDFTGALALPRAPDPSVPGLPAPTLGNSKVAEQAVLNALTGTLEVGVPYPLPSVNAMPSQELAPPRPPVP